MSLCCYEDKTWKNWHVESAAYILALQMQSLLPESRATGMVSLQRCLTPSLSHCGESKTTSHAPSEKAPISASGYAQGSLEQSFPCSLLKVMCMGNVEKQEMYMGKGNRNHVNKLSPTLKDCKHPSLAFNVGGIDLESCIIQECFQL